MLSVTHYLSCIITLSLVAAVGVFSFFKVKSADDFSVGGRRLPAAAVTGAIVGSFAGGTVTIGTAQMAYSLGVGAMWFTIGAGVSCLLLAILMVKPMREKEVVTVTEFLVLEYGPSIRMWVAFFTAAGMFIQAAVQIMAAVPVLKGLLPVSSVTAAAMTAVLMVLYVAGGGIWGTSMVGLVKLLLLSVSLFAGGYYSLSFFGGPDGVMQALPAGHLQSMVPRGALVDLGGAFSVIVGFASTQAFLQPLYAAKDVRTARLGAVYSAVLIPLYGLAGTAVGLFMRVRHPGIDPVSALPGFIFGYLAPWLAGMAAATLLVSLVLTAGALTLAVSTVLTRDIYCYLRPHTSDARLLLLNRGFVPLAGAAALLMALTSIDSLILDWTYLSNAMRGAAVFLPLLGAVLLPGRLKAGGVYWSVICGPLATILWAIFSPLDVHPLFVGLSVALACIVAAPPTSSITN